MFPLPNPSIDDGNIFGDFYYIGYVRFLRKKVSSSNHNFSRCRTGIDY